MQNVHDFRKRKFKVKSRLPGKDFVGEFSSLTMSSDGGMILLNEIEEENNFIKLASTCILDGRKKGRSIYSLEQILKSRVFAIACGYEDVNDLTTLRHDCMIKESIGIDPSSEQGIPSQPTASRFENSFKTKEEVAEFALALPKLYTQSAYKNPPKKVILDLDETFLACHGSQQDALFSGYEHSYGYKPLFVIDTKIGCVLAISERPARTLSGKEVKKLFEPVFKEIRKAWPSVEIVVRGDGHYGRDEFLTWCEETEGVSFITGFTKNSKLMTHKEVERTIERASQKLLRIEEKEKNKDMKTKEVREYCTFNYAAAAWERERTMVARVLVYRDNGEIKVRVRYIITSLAKNYSPKHLYKMFYAKRGQAENIIKDVKRYLKGNRQSCKSILANHVRLILHGLAHWYFVKLSQAIPRYSKYKKASIPNLQLLLLKIAVQMKVRARTVQTVFSCSTPTQDLFLKVLEGIRSETVDLSPVPT